MSKTESIIIDKGLAVYRQTRSSGAKSSNWYSRVYWPNGNTQYHTRTTGTSDLKIARQKARDHRFEVEMLKRGVGDLSALRQGRVDPTMRFDHIAERRLSELEAVVGEDRKLKGQLKNEKELYYATNGAARFFGKRDISTIGTDDFRQFLKFRVDNSKKGSLAPASQKRAMSSVRAVFKYAFEQRLISTIPLMPKIKLEQTPRGWFNKQEYRLLWEKARSLARQAKKSGDDDGYRHWMEMFDFVIFMVNSFLRPSEWADLQHRHIRVLNGDNPYLEIAVVRGKTRKRFTLSMPRAVTVYKRMVARDGGEPTTYLFKDQFKNRQTASERMRDHFELLLKATSLKQDRFDNRRTIGSLRHSSLMFRLLEGDNVDLRILAQNAGTSIKQLDDFYLSHADASMKLDNLHSFKRRVVRPV